MKNLRLKRTQNLSSNHLQDLKIAWRYQDEKEQNKPNVQNQITKKNPYIHNFDLSKRMDPDDLFKNRERIHLLDLHAIHSADSDKSIYPTLFSQLVELAESYQSQDQNTVPPLRICLHALGSSSWGSFSNSEREPIHFLQGLRGLLRRTGAVCLSTLPSLVHFSRQQTTTTNSPQSNSSQKSSLQHLPDTLVTLRGIGEEEEQVLGEYSGLLYIRKAPRVGCLQSPAHAKVTANGFSATSFGVIRSRRKLSVEVLSLMPEVSRTPTGPPSAAVTVAPENRLPHSHPHSHDTETEAGVVHVRQKKKSSKSSGRNAASSSANLCQGHPSTPSVVDF
eukprot:TRINITY_DN2649_c0_g1_i1.p1 TRINITY_DN2649_c0_g1~~TRINITY_DN2649_c0_g1_i1.p1  ORF type:complete len:334 (+),score=77.58 TRINITY_DN2649_c0_g1_i1:318-1319(+)